MIHKKLIHALLVLLIIAPGVLGARASQAADYGGRLGVAEILARSPAHLLLFKLSASFPSGAGRNSVWTNISPNEEALAAAVSSSLCDVIFIDNEDALKKLEEAELLRETFPLFTEDIILAGPASMRETFAPMSADAAMKAVYDRGLKFFKLRHNVSVEGAEREMWRRAGVKEPWNNKQYIESSRDDVTALFQIGDEEAFALAGEASFGEYSASYRDGAPLVKMTAAGIKKTYYVCLTNISVIYLPERAAAADKLAEWLRGDEAGNIISSFAIGGVKPFKTAKQ
jgi:ABC-type tungstate transport system permease subunit